ncbi:hypothetical protein CAPTEDRAFT_195541, partial [Capitella teleta]
MSFEIDALLADLQSTTSCISSYQQEQQQQQQQTPRLPQTPCVQETIYQQVNHGNHSQPDYPSPVASVGSRDFDSRESTPPPLPPPPSQDVLDSLHADSPV